MNLSKVVSPVGTVAFRTWRTIISRVPGGRFQSFGEEAHQIGAILVVNLDRQPDRWRRVSRELARFKTSDGRPLTSITRRLSAIDARDGRAVAATADVDAIYRIGDQLYVQPDVRLAASFAEDEPVRMTRQEVAVARSHIEAWKSIAVGAQKFVLILEDDVWFKPGARGAIDRGWRAALGRFGVAGPRLFYVSYEDAGGTAAREGACEDVFRAVRGLWFLSGYVLSREGASALLHAMPVVGPVDLWMNYRFAELDALALTVPALEQRHDAVSDNSYSMMPFLARAGIVDADLRSKPPTSTVAGSVLAWTDCGDRESLAMALAMLGLRVCVFDGTEVPMSRQRLVGAFEAFDALVDPPVVPADLQAVVADERVVVLLEANADPPTGLDLGGLPPARSGILPSGDSWNRSWEVLCDVLGVDKPVDEFPGGAPREFRTFRDGRSTSPTNSSGTPAQASEPMDDSPWVLPAACRWRPAPIQNVAPHPGRPVVVESSMTSASSEFPCMTETFPGNLAAFVRGGLQYGDGGVRLILDAAEGGLRPFQSGAFASTRSFTHGRFQAEIRAAAGPGLVTGFFLHRSAPRQEVDIELTGADPRRMLINVYFNPGDDGSAMAFGYRGSPHWVDLGFDATEDFHEYAIDWRPGGVAWIVDGRVVHERASWDPTPIPHLAMRVHGNLWAPRSPQFGRMNASNLPATAAFRNVRVTG